MKRTRSFTWDCYRNGSELCGDGDSVTTLSLFSTQILCSEGVHTLRQLKTYLWRPGLSGSPREQYVDDEGVTGLLSDEQYEDLGGVISYIEPPVEPMGS